MDECRSSPCQHKGKCTDKIAGYSCSCVVGFTGFNCDVNIDDCASAPCKNGGVCFDRANAYTCDCPSGWAGAHCDQPVSLCATQELKLCDRHATCQHTGPGSHSCKCHIGYRGSGNLTANGSPITSGGTTWTPEVTIKVVDGVPGFTTYQLAVAQTGKLTSIYSVGGSVDSTLKMPAAFQVAPPFGVDVAGVGQKYLGYNNASKYDSWLTVGLVSGDPSQQIGQQGLNFRGWTQSAGLVSTGSVFWKDPSQAPATAKVQVAQITVPSSTFWQASLLVKAKTASGDINATVVFKPTGGCVEINECDSSPCQNGATCVDRLNSYRCRCASGFKLDECQKGMPT